MTVVSIAVIWLVVGLVVAIIFGNVIGRTNRSEDDAVPRHKGADVKYLRRAAKRLGREVGRVTAAETLKKHRHKPHALA